MDLEDTIIDGKEAYLDDEGQFRYINGKLVPIYIDDNGYYRFRVNDQLVHRKVAELMIGRCLEKYEIVHHLNGDKLDNRPENLHVCENQDEHEGIHEAVRKRGGLE